MPSGCLLMTFPASEHRRLKEPGGACVASVGSTLEGGCKWSLLGMRENFTSVMGDHVNISRCHFSSIFHMPALETYYI